MVSGGDDLGAVKGVVHGFFKDLFLFFLIFGLGLLCFVLHQLRGFFIVRIPDLVDQTVGDEFEVTFKDFQVVLKFKRFLMIGKLGVFLQLSGGKGLFLNLYLS